MTNVIILKYMVGKVCENLLRKATNLRVINLSMVVELQILTRMLEL
ncbi:MAG: hypothetical protein K0R15_1040 [Clostridiales bacterium]|jgi:hypothetical protein|nr:hypothetical protein [Clostridiales bacterium]